ncbi:MAG: gliding motility protein GldN [Bacteroidales bacterium]|nr:gliding motility protein GldN [Bacteroidales bacterium]
MKKVTLALVILFCLGLTNAGFAQVMEEDSESGQWNSFYEEVHKGAFKAFDFPPVREADIVLSTRIWRTIDFREKQNQIFYYPLVPTQGRVSLYYVLDKAALDGLIRVYEDDDCTKEIDWAKVKASLGTTKTITTYVYDSIDEMDKEVNQEITNSIKADDVIRLRVKEDWFIDKQRSVRDVRIISFALVLSQEGGKGDLPLFYVHYDDPEVRQLLANTQVFNPKNDAQRLSYDDLFTKRLFSSYIIQQSDTQARNIQSYLTGEDQLLESDRIENELFEMDEDMWEY